MRITYVCGTMQTTYKNKQKRKKLSKKLDLLTEW